MGDDATTPNDDASKAPPSGDNKKTPAAAPAPSAPVANPAAPVNPSGNPLQDDIAQILGKVKLPERHSTLPQEAVPEKHYDTTLADPTSPAPHGEASPRGIPVQPAVSGDTPGATPSDSASHDDLRSLHTLKDDLQHVVQENKISYVRAIALEEEKRHRIEARSPNRARKSGRSFFMLFIVGILIGTGALALGAVYLVTEQRTGKENASLRSNILFAEQSVPFPVDNEAPADVRRTLASARTSGALTLGAILQIVPVHTQTNASGDPETTLLTFGEFLNAMGTRAPDDLARALSDDFFFGIHTVDENAPVIVVPVTSYERAFAAMLAWEPDMNADLQPLFTLMPEQTTNSNGLPVERKFDDTVMRNYDVRALKDDTGTIQLYYSFPTRNILIIAESPFSFTEILSRLRADRRL